MIKKIFMKAEYYEKIKRVFEKNLKGHCFEGVDINEEIKEQIKKIDEEIEVIQVEVKEMEEKRRIKDAQKIEMAKAKMDALMEKRYALLNKVPPMKFKSFCDKFNIPLTFEEYKKKAEEEPILSIISVSISGSFAIEVWPYLLESGFHEEHNGKRIFVFLFKDRFYIVEGTYTWEEARLLVLEDYDKERKKFERLKLLYDSEEVKEDSKSRPPIPEEVKIAVWRRDNGRCVKCGSQENLEYDHIIPFAKGGSNTARNIQLLCEKCNRQKRDNLV
ncbi:MAG TPA: HNH endonuclease signature motif containing protein [bacterium]|nr:HNH endonuclease signature motif containing protein [bacterium]